MTAQNKVEKAHDILASELIRQAHALVEDLRKGELRKDDEPPPGDGDGDADDAGADVPPPDAGADMPPVDEAGDGGDMPSHEELVAAFSALPPEQLQAYKAALDEAMGGGGDMAPDAGADMPPDGGDAPPPPDAMKSEIAAMVKSEFAKFRAELVKSQAAPKAAPRPRAVAPQAQPQRPAPALRLGKAEVMAVLTRQSRRRDLSKSDRSLITDFCEGRVDQARIAHLLSEKA